MELLESEVEFNEALVATLEHVRYANALLERTQEAAVRGDVEGALARLEDAEASVFGVAESTRAREALMRRVEGLKKDLRETSSECWDAFLRVDFDGEKFGVRRKGLQADVPDAQVRVIGLEMIVAAVKGLGIFAPLVAKLGRDLVAVLFRPCVVVDEDGLVAGVRVGDAEVEVGGKKSDDVSAVTLFQHLAAILDFLATRLPASITGPLSETLIPALSSLLEEHWLEPAIPLDLSETEAFTSILEDTERLVEQIEGYQWHGTERLTTWIENAPTMWLTKQREAILGEARNLVFSGLKERKVVERVETRVVKREDPVLEGTGGGVEEDEWDSAWDEPDDEKTATKSDVAAKNQVTNDDDDEDSNTWGAWGAEDDEPPNQDESTAQNEAEDENEDWGAWDDESSSKPPSPITKRTDQPKKVNGNPSQPTGDQHLTLRETLTTTTIPSTLLTLLQNTISTAETLSSPTGPHATSPLAPAAIELFRLPTLALAIYRATAPTAYSKLDDGVGNMLIYNDALHLSDLLRSWSNSRPAESGRLRLDADLVALEGLAKRAYGVEMESQRTILRDILDGAQGFGNCTVPPFKGECEAAVEGTVGRLRDVHGLWRGVLSQGALLQSLGSLLGTVTGKMVGEIEELGDIAEAESKQLRVLCDRVTAVREIFVQQVSPTSEGDGEGQGQDMTFVYCPTWLKFQYLAEILESSLADIRWMWKEGELRLEFEADEVVELIEALFAESEYRRNAVREIRRGGG